MTRRTVLLLAFVALLVAPGMTMAQGEQTAAHAVLEWADGERWNGISTTQVLPGERVAHVWLPPEARIQHVAALMPDDAGGLERVPASWRSAGAEALAVELPQDARIAEVRFDVAARRGLLQDFVAPRALDHVSVRILPPPGMVPLESFVEAEPGEWRASASDVPEGMRWSLRIVDAQRVGELPVLATVVLVAALGLALGVLWHRVRPPLGDRPPERFLEHLGELQARLLPPLALFLVLNIAYFTMGLRTWSWNGIPLVMPTFGPEHSLSARTFDAFAERIVPGGVQLIVTGPVDAVLAQFQTTLFLAFVSTLPLLFYELAVFLGPALDMREQRLALRILPLMSGLFFVGALFGLMWMAPLMMRILYGYAPALGAVPFLLLSDLVSFALVVLFVFGLAFELPVVMHILSRVGIVAAATWRKYWRHAVVVMFLVGGIVTPDPSIVTQALVALPLCVLYVLGAAAAQRAERGRAQPANERRPE